MTTVNGVELTLTNTQNANDVISFTSCKAGGLLCGAFFMCVPNGTYTLSATRAGFSFQLKDGPALPANLTFPDDIDDLNTILTTQWRPVHDGQ